MSKYGNQPVEVEGLKFDSKAEARRWQELRLLEQAGEISDLTVHPRYPLSEFFEHDGKQERPIYYEADFAYHQHQPDRQVVEDVKGCKTPVYLLKRKLFLYKFGRLYDFREVEA